MLVRHLPRTSATSEALYGEIASWTTEAVLLADLYGVWAGEPHPALPKATDDKARAADARKRLQAQRKRLQGGTP